MSNQSDESNGKRHMSGTVLPVLGGVPGAGGPLHPQVMADVLAGRERYGAELLALGAARAAPGANADPNQLVPEVDMSKVEERHLAVSRADVQEEDEEEVNLSGRELRLLVHLGAMSARLQRKFMPQLGDANTVRDLRELLTVIKDITATADESTVEAFATVGLTVLDSVLRNDEFTAVVEEYGLMLQDAVAAGGPVPPMLRKAPRKFAPKMHMHFYFRVLKQTWDFSFGEGSLQVDVRFELAHRVLAHDKGGCGSKDESSNENLDDQASPLDKTFDTADCLELPLGPAAGGGQVVFLPPDAYAVLEDGTTVCNSSAVAGIPLVRRAKESHFHAAVAPASRMHEDVPEQPLYRQQVQHAGPLEWEHAPGMLNGPCQTAFDRANDRILVADSNAGPRLRVLGMDGRHKEWLVVKGLKNPRSMALDADTGVIIVSSFATNELIMVDGEGDVLHQFMHPDLKQPNQVIITDVAGGKEIYVASNGTKSVVVFDMLGQHMRTIKHGFEARGVAVGPDGLVYVSNLKTAGSIEVFSQHGQHVRQFASGLKKPFHISFNSQGFLAVGGGGANHVTVLAPDGSVFYEGRDCNRPIGVHWVSDRQLLVSISGDHRVELLTVPGLAQG